MKDAELEAKQPLKQVSIEEILEAQRQQQEEKEREKKKKETILRSKGINPSEHSEGFSWKAKKKIIINYYFCIKLMIPRDIQQQ